MAYNTSYLSSPDTPSTVFPERLIRPLPRRSIKSRLSQEAVEAIQYPPTLPSSSLPAYSNYGEKGEETNDGKVLEHHHSDNYYNDHDHDHDHDHDDDDECPHHHHHHHHHHHCHHDEYEDDLDSQDERIYPPRRFIVSSPRSPRSGRSRYSTRGSTSGPDGYEAFENTNNKKKRKIPTSGSLSLHQSAVTDQLAHMGISGTKDGTADDGFYAGAHAGNTAGLGVQGAGRGRGARKALGRNPLGVSVNGSNARIGPSKYDQNMTANAKGKVERSSARAIEADFGKAEETKDQGIISTAIAKATALLPKPLGKGQEHVGVLDQEAKQAHNNSQFTFTCEADAKGVTFPEQSLYSPGYTQRNNPTHPTAAEKGNIQPSQNTANATVSVAQPAPAAPVAQNANAQGKKPRRRRGDVYALAARQRKLQQEYNNLQHPPAPEDIWICEFCEYESIFGQPPHALIRQYEIKDRKERRRLAEKRRLLEKAKLKGRKGKKQTKNAAKAANHNAGTVNQQAYDNQPLDQLADDDLDYGYDDDPIPMPAPPPATTANKAVVGPRTATTDKAGGTAGGGGIR
ncbi:hypothetical protein A1O7_02806 [Cladophialophora yegresii CBS 114405]|uniref:Uncharacterized protein n=1 Tax=Cladophialophora yegresii CBS 114405 TaxID=1182544 RepID=W9W2U7_9EURO|nr:uncharacterized protein A1O7_02806 [Cladophialophora yegresii CBS 114405]EXJ62372.1 hypothetical protein A1O7_02806 [Cladophialophora yegresii CBS 114405]